MYTFDGRIRYSECDSEGKLSIPALVDYFQDCSTFHSEDLGIGLSYLEERNLAWILASWQIEIHRMPSMGERVIIGTVPYIIRDFLGHRNFILQTKEKETLAVANSLWTLFDMKRMKPSHPTAEMLEGYVLGERLPMDYKNRKIVLDEGGEKLDSIRVESYHLDTNYHVNNAQYINMAASCLPPDLSIRSVRAEYKKQAHLGDLLIPYRTLKEGCVGISLQSPKGEIFLNTEWSF